MKAEIGKRYRHYKNGREYTVLHIGRHTETLEEVVVYRAEYTSSDFGASAIWVRPRAMFEGTIEHEGRVVQRFTDGTI